MPRIIDWPAVAAPRDLARHLARSLRSGWVVALPTGTAYVAAAWARSPDAVRRLLPLATASPELAVPGPAAARDWAHLNAPARRLAARLWPGPLTLLCADGAAEGLVSSLPPDARAAAAPAGEVHLCSPGHEAITELLRWLPGPLLLAPVGAGAPPTTARQAEAALGDRVDLILDDGPAPLDRPATVVHVAGDSWRVARPGALDEGRLRQALARRVVFVCTGNTCRSPLAEALCKARLAARLGCPVEELPARGYLVQSAGLAAAPGMPAAEEAVLVAAALGAADLLAHQSQQLTPDLARAADLLLAMTAGHLAVLQQHLPDAPARLLSPAGDDVADPIGQPLAVYEACARQMADYIDPVVEALLR